eukprot:12045511-Alexandrium_andersonii.AAC.1
MRFAGTSEQERFGSQALRFACDSKLRTARFCPEILGDVGAEPTARRLTSKTVLGSSMRPKTHNA